MFHICLLLSFLLVARRKIIEQFRIHFHISLQNIIDQCNNGLIPVLLADAIERREHNGHNNCIILFNQRHGVLIVPKV